MTGLTLELSAGSSSVLISRGDDVPVDLWTALDRNIAPLQAQRVGDNQIVVPLERLLASRNWLAQALTQYRTAVGFDDSLLAVLRRQDDESHEVTRLLAGAPQPDEIAVTELLADGRFVRQLRDFQRRDLAGLLSLSHGANFSVPGAGKTTVAYASYQYLKARGTVEQLLVVAPLSAFEAWHEEATACLNPAPKVAALENRAPPGTEVLLVNYQRLVSRAEPLARWMAAKPTHLILDEAHRMKRGRDGEWGAACLDLAHLAVRRDVLTGTPAPQHPSDFIALLEFLWPHQARRILPRSALVTNPRPEAMTDVSQRIRPLFVRTKKDELGLREPHLRVELCDMKPVQQEIYDALRTRMRRATAGRDTVAFARMGAVTMHLLQAASNPALLAHALGSDSAAALEWPPLAIPEGSALGDLVRGYSRHEMPVKFDKLASMVAAASADGGRKTLVWSNFVGNLEALVEVLGPHRPAIVHGGVPVSNDSGIGRTREHELRRFREDDACTVLVANPAAMSEGVSLHGVCHEAIYVDRTFNAGQYLQSLDRIHRLGLAPTTATNITFLVNKTSIDETIDGRIRVKAERLARMLEDVNLVTMALPDEEDYGESIDPEDLDSLYAHLVSAHEPVSA